MPKGHLRCSRSSTTGVIVPLSLDDLTNVVFRKPGISKRGYREEEVDGFLDRIAATFRAHEQADATGADLVTPVDVHHVTFNRASFVGRGYNEADVDSFLDLVEAELLRLCEGDTPAGSTSSVPSTPDVDLLEPGDVENLEFARPPFGKRGYDADEVDEFVQRVQDTLRGDDNLSSSQVSRIVFGKGMRGGRVYSEQDVDLFLDRAEETLTWNEKIDARKISHPHPKAS